MLNPGVADPHERNNRHMTIAVLFVTDQIFTAGLELIAVAIPIATPSMRFQLELVPGMELHQIVGWMARRCVNTR